VPIDALYTAENQILFEESPKCSMTSFDWSGVSHSAAVVLLFWPGMVTFGVLAAIANFLMLRPKPALAIRHCIGSTLSRHNQASGEAIDSGKL